MRFLSVISVLLLVPLTSAFPITVHYPTRDLSIRTSSVSPSDTELEPLFQNARQNEEWDRTSLDKRDLLIPKFLKDKWNGLTETANNLKGLAAVNKAAGEHLKDVAPITADQTMFQKGINTLKNMKAKAFGAPKVLDKFNENFVARPPPGSKPIVVYPKELPKDKAATAPSTTFWGRWFGKTATPPSTVVQAPPPKMTWWQTFKAKFFKFKGKIWPFGKKKVNTNDQLNTSAKSVTTEKAITEKPTEKSVPEVEAREPNWMERNMPEGAGGLRQSRIDAMTEAAAKKKALEPVDARNPTWTERNMPEGAGGLPQWKIDAMKAAMKEKNAITSSLQTQSIQPQVNVDSSKIHVEQLKSPNVNTSPKFQQPQSSVTGKTDSSNAQVEQVKSPVIGTSNDVNDLSSSTKLDSSTLKSTSKVGTDPDLQGTNQAPSEGWVQKATRVGGQTLANVGEWFNTWNG